MAGGGAEEAAVEAAGGAVDLDAELAAERHRERTETAIDALVGERAAKSGDLAVDAIDRLYAADRGSLGGHIGAERRDGNEAHAPNNGERSHGTQQRPITQHLEAP